MRSFEAEVEEFKRWALSLPGRYGEWETEYQRWPQLRDAAVSTLSASRLDPSTVDRLLYVLARDNECEILLDALEEHPAAALHLARAGIAYGDPEARWQLAVHLGTRDELEAVTLLRHLLQDSNEYVRRRALLASTRHDAQHAEQTAIRWLQATEEYSRLAALSALAELGSEALPDAVSRLRDDPSSVVRARLAELEGAS